MDWLCAQRNEGLITCSGKGKIDYVFCRMMDWLCLQQNDGLFMCSAEWRIDHVFCRKKPWLCVLQSDDMIMCSAKWWVDYVFCQMRLKGPRCIQKWIPIMRGGNGKTFRNTRTAIEVNATGRLSLSPLQSALPVVFGRMTDWLCVLQNEGLIMRFAKWMADYVLCNMKPWLCVLQNEG